MNEQDRRAKSTRVRLDQAHRLPERPQGAQPTRPAVHQASNTNQKAVTQPPGISQVEGPRLSSGEMLNIGDGTVTDVSQLGTEQILELAREHLDSQQSERAARTREVNVKRAQVGTGRRAFKMKPRDKAVLEFLARYGAATRPQIERRFAWESTSARRRFAQYKDQGLVRAVSSGPCRYYLQALTEEGRDAIGSDLSIPPLNRWSTTIHTLGVTQLGIIFELAGETVRSEAEIRHDAAFLRRTRAGQHHGSRNIYPDLIVERARGADGRPEKIAIELELTQKNQTKLLDVMKRYRAAEGISGIAYYASTPGIKNAVEFAAAEVGIAHRVGCHDWNAAGTPEMGLNPG